MRILLCGAHGFLGRHISRTLLESGHEVIHGVHRFSDDTSAQGRELLIDYVKDTSTDIWEKRLAALGKIDIVINAVGILMQSKHAPFTAIHRDAPIALFRAACDAGVRGILQISALGPDDNMINDRPSNQHALSVYMQTKREADHYLSQLPCPHLILRPSLLIGVDGASSKLFRSLASLPMIGLPGNGEQQLQPVHVKDLCLGVIKWLAQVSSGTVKRHQIIRAVGPNAMSYRDMLAHYRQAMGLSQARFTHIPMSIMRISARLATYLPQKVFAPETLQMLEQGSVADNTAFTKLLEQKPRGVSAWFDQDETNTLAASAMMAWATMLFRLVLAFLWISTGIISLWVYPIEGSANLLAQVGISAHYASPVLWLASGLDLILGILSLIHPSRRLWIFQSILILTYSAIISVCLPEFLTHPFAPILKNLPILAILFVLIASDKK
ncbi:SDR family oxidoreductase [Undibacterium amnicola]|uniref:SDR family oxidoreductase n=1 Tax=Undibacterium amnicola TaxID=1834038 RepID=A0ABR6XKH1_9BURK|nr:SDR family oxidoreductase [Undibacterium amnicola]MBC3830007.1 SDR family oxidoreductase [Undibacterium amnicola]